MGLGTEFQTGYQEDLRKVRHVTNHIHSAGIRQMMVKIKKENLMHFDPAARVPRICP